VSGPRRHAAGLFEGEPEPAARAPAAGGRRRWSATQIAAVAVLAACGLAMVGVTALGLPLALIGGKVALVLPIAAVILLLRSGRRR
jgi:hypothetical protein